MQNLNVRERIQDFVSTLPDTVSIKAYGSSVAFQSGYKEDEKKQIDLIVIVDDIKKFYEESLVKNAYMYKFIPRVYFNNASKDKLRTGAHICYTSNINYKDDVYKIGVIEKEDVLNDLINWETFYIAGRMQKEMYTVKEDEVIEKANKINQHNALVVSLLLTDKNDVKLSDVYETLCSLSYMGDSRKKFKAEDPNKVKKIASGSKDYFDSLYKNSNLFIIDDNEKVKINYELLFKEIDKLPSNLKDRINDYDLNNIRSVITNYLEQIIKSSSSEQTKKGILTTGLTNSISYAHEKLKKGRKR